MPVISMFYGIVVLMHYFDDKRHNTPHIHARYSDEEAVVSIPDGNVMAGALPTPKLKLVLAWIEIHKEELLANWRLASEGQQVFTIDPLK